jgi:hypothetical protein
MREEPVNKFDRRKEDLSCKEHEERIDRMDGDIRSISMQLKIAGSILSIAMIVLGALSNLILTKLTNIESLLNKNDIVLMEHSQRIKNCEQDIADIKERHKFIDQEGVLKKKK